MNVITPLHVSHLHPGSRGLVARSLRVLGDAMRRREAVVFLQHREDPTPHNFACYHCSSRSCHSRILISTAQNCLKLEATPLQRIPPQVAGDASGSSHQRNSMMKEKLEHVKESLDQLVPPQTAVPPAFGNVLDSMASR